MLGRADSHSRGPKGGSAARPKLSPTSLTSSNALFGVFDFQDCLNAALAISMDTANEIAPLWHIYALSAEPDFTRRSIYTRNLPDLRRGLLDANFDTLYQPCHTQSRLCG